MSDSREEFEAVALRLGFSLTMRCPESEDGEYLFPVTHGSWNIWQAACDWQSSAQDSTDSSCTCEARKTLLEIHKITACISEVEELDGTEQLTVSRVKQMAQYINQMSVSAQEGGEWVVAVRTNDYGQVYLCNPDGSSFIPSNHVGDTYYTHPPSTVVPEWFDPYSTPPTPYQPVVGYHQEWIDSSNHAGVRECFTTGYGDVWLNSAWLEGGDSYQTGKMVPLLWTHMPAPSKQEVIGDE